MYELSPCPFCKEKPWIFPQNPSVEGDAWGRVACVNEKCITSTGFQIGVFKIGLTIGDGEDVIRSGFDYRYAAAKRWNAAMSRLRLLET